MNEPEPIKIETPYKTIVAKSMDDIKIVNGIEVIDGGLVKHNGKIVPLYVRITGKTDLENRVDAWKAAWKAYNEAKAAEFAANVPGLTELRKAKDAVYNDNVRYREQFEAMMEDESNDGVNPPAPIDKALLQTANDLAAQYPRAALYLKAEDYTYSDNHHKYSAGKKAMALLAEGGDLEEAESILDNWLPD